MIQIDTKRFMYDISSSIAQRLMVVAEVIEENMKKEIDMLPESGSKESIGEPELREYVRDLIFSKTSFTLNEVFSEVGLINSQEDEESIYRALMVNYGIGEYMSNANPWLGQYLSSAYFNKDRVNNIIYTRPNEQYYDPHLDEWVYSKAKDPARPIPNFSQLPSYFFENAITKIGDSIPRIIEEVIDEIDFSKYLIER